VEQPKEVWMLLYHVCTLFRHLSQEQTAMYVPTYGWFKPKSDLEFQVRFSLNVLAWLTRPQIGPFRRPQLGDSFQAEIHSPGDTTTSPKACTAKIENA
jgi:hypothetical protein